MRTAKFVPAKSGVKVENLSLMGSVTLLDAVCSAIQAVTLALSVSVAIFPT